MVNGRRVRFVSIALVSTLSAWSHAQTAPPIKLGLWQIQSDRQIDGQKAPDLAEHLQKMTPDMRKRMEANMKKHGVDMSGEPGTVRMCQTKESLDQGRWQGAQGRCRTDFTSRTASAWKWRATCDQPPSETDGVATFASPEAYTVSSTTRLKLQGKPQVATMKLQAKWLGADCGDLKPVAQPGAGPASSVKP